MSTANFYALFGGPPRSRSEEQRYSEFHLVILNSLNVMKYVYGALGAMTYAQRSQMILAARSFHTVSFATAKGASPAIAQKVAKLVDVPLAAIEAYGEAHNTRRGFMMRKGQTTPAEFEAARMALLSAAEDWIAWLESIQPDTPR